MSEARVAAPGLAAAVDAALDRAIGLLPWHGPLSGLRDELGEFRARQAGRLRVAVTGRPGTGKSTLIAAVGDGLPFDIVEVSTEGLADVDPDAIVLAMSRRGAGRTDIDAVRDFQRLGLTSEIASPLNAIGVLAVEAYWDADHPAPDAVAEPVIRQLMTDAGGSRLLSAVRLVATRVGAAARTLTAADLADLTRLAEAVDATPLEELAENAADFAAAQYVDLPVPPDRRAELIRRFTGYGIVLGCAYLRTAAASTTATTTATTAEGAPSAEEGLRQWLLDRSGAMALREQLIRQFGDNAELIRLHRLTKWVRRVAADLIGQSRGGLTPWDVTIVGHVVSLLREEAFDDDAWQRFAAVQHLYTGQVQFSGGDTEESLRLLGERGATLAVRLGVAADAPPADLVAEAERLQRKWARLGSRPYTGQTSRAWTVVLRTCDALVIEARALHGKIEI